MMLQSITHVSLSPGPNTVQKWTEKLTDFSSGLLIYSYEVDHMMCLQSSVSTDTGTVQFWKGKLMIVFGLFLNIDLSRRWGSTAASSSFF